MSQSKMASEHLHLLEMKSITKTYPGVVALNDVSVKVNKGEIHALLGANGAGKSTLVKILCGAIRQDKGEIFIDGKKVNISTPADAIASGISYVPQELNLVPDMTVCQNIMFGHEPMMRWWLPFINERKLEELAMEMLDLVDLRVDIHTLTKNLPVSSQQMVSIATSLYNQSKIIILDEPTSSLSSSEISNLFAILKKLKQEGETIIFITHHLDEVFEVADRISILRDSIFQGDFDVSDISREEIVTIMTGKEELFSKQLVKTEKTDCEALRLDCVNTGKISKDISFNVNCGEILGLFGQVGAGRTEVLRAIFGADPIHSGDIYLFGERTQLKSPRDAINHGIGFITEDRKSQGLILSMDLLDNINMGTYEKSMRFGFIITSLLRKITAHFRDALNIKNSDLTLWTKYLSGGNQQKVVLAKWLNHESKILLMDEPTKGIDVGAKQEFYQLIKELAGKGVAIVLVTSELPEVVALSDRVIVFRQGTIVGEVDPLKVSTETIMSMTL